VVLRQHASLVEPLHREHANPDDTNSAVELYLQATRTLALTLALALALTLTLALILTLD